ncbi:MAG TPA: nucleotidyltransferase domain-containing protein [Candidatus Lachnoclostridium pullistercoris]|uniref:Nucleotidyltransferase domain-containing protein n=1 Tax=Candidatus Lachnoclostridium pullistercoris TaxID=2838632 RepID=A0A9D2T7T0_9FIRM|nr:nucleotidyltransferase domain-containing protein [Candidatus Lachnoclostridium pullistercoris]
MPQILSEILKRYVEDVHRIYGEKLKTVILYGSYARGDFRPDSDIDIMILVDLPDDEIRSRGHALSDLTFNYNFDNNLKIMPIVKNLEHFNKWLRAYPFYNNVKNEGVELYAA